MGRRKASGLDIVAALPCPAGIVFGIIAFFGIRYGIGAYLQSAPTGTFKQLGPNFAGVARTWVLAVALLALFSKWRAVEWFAVLTALALTAGRLCTQLTG
jgi:restriction system protein